MKHLQKTLCIALCMFIFGCSDSGPNIENHTNEANMKMDFKNFFTGKIDTYGMIQDWRGNVTSTFTVDINVTWKGNKGEMVEHFVFDGSRKLKRIWYVTKHNDGTYSATADDVVGEAKGIEKGLAINFEYKLQVPHGKSTITLKADDNMFMVTKDSILNKTTLYKFGLPVSYLTMFLKKV